MTDPIEIMARAHWVANSRPSSRSWDELKPNERTQKRNAIRTSLHALRASGFDIVPLSGTVDMVAAFWRQKNAGTQEVGETGPDTHDMAAMQAAIEAGRVKG